MLHCNANTATVNSFITGQRQDPREMTRNSIQFIARPVGKKKVCVRVVWIRRGYLY